MTLQIRTEQIESMIPVTDARYLDRLLELVTGGSELAKSDPATREECQKLMKQSQTYNFATEFEITAFVACGFAFGADFDSRPDLSFRRILLEPETDPRIKAAQMLMLLEESEKES